MSEIKTALERFQAYCASKGIPEKSSLAHIHKMGQFEEHERKELRAAYESLQKENIKIEDELDQYKEYYEEMSEHYKGLQFIESELRKENAAQAKQPTELSYRCKVAASCLTYNDTEKEAVAKHLLLEASQELRRAQAQQPTAYRVIASANGEVVRDSLEFTRMSEIDEKVVRKSYDLEIVPLYAAMQSQAQQESQAFKALKGMIELWFRTRESGCLPIEVAHAQFVLKTLLPQSPEGE